MSNKSINEFKDAMSVIKSRGIVKTNILKSNAVYRYDFKTGKFKEYSKEKLYKLFNRLYLNSYDVNYSIDQVFNELDAIDFNKVNNYYKYKDAIKKDFNLADMENKIKMYLKLNSKNKKSFAPIQWKPQSQLQHLINNDVFTNGKLICKYKPGANDFDAIAPNDLIKLFRNVENKEYLSQIGVKNNYGFFINNLVNIRTLYDNLKEYKMNKRILTNCKNDYEVIKSVIDGFN